MAKKQWTDRVEISRPIADVWKVVADPKASTKWIQGLTAVEMTAPGDVKQGSRFNATRTVGKRTTTEEISVLEFSPPNRFVVGAGVMGGGIGLRIVYSLRPSGSGTVVESVTEAEGRSFSGKLFFGMFWKAVTTNDAGNLGRLRSVVESGAA